MIVTVNKNVEPIEFPMSQMKVDSFALITQSPNTTIKKGDVVYRTVTTGCDFPYQFIGKLFHEASSYSHQYKVRYLQPGESIIIQEDNEQV